MHLRFSGLHVVALLDEPCGHVGGDAAPFVPVVEVGESEQRLPRTLFLVEGCPDVSPGAFTETEAVPATASGTRPLSIGNAPSWYRRVISCWPFSVTVMTEKPGHRRPR